MVTVSTYNISIALLRARFFFFYRLGPLVSGLPFPKAGQPARPPATAAVGQRVTVAVSGTLWDSAALQSAYILLSLSTSPPYARHAGTYGTVTVTLSSPGAHRPSSSVQRGYPVLARAVSVRRLPPLL